MLIPPKAGDPEKVEKDGKGYTYCTRCRRWTTGPKRHSSDEHVTRTSGNSGSGGNSGGSTGQNSGGSGNGPSAGSSGRSSEQGNLVQSGGRGGGLRFMGSLLTSKFVDRFGESPVRTPTSWSM